MRVVSLERRRSADEVVREGLRAVRNESRRSRTHGRLGDAIGDAIDDESDEDGATAEGQTDRAVTWLTVQRVSDSRGTFRQAPLDVVADVVVHFAAWRSSAPPNTPLAATTTAGTAPSRARPARITGSLRMTRLRHRLSFDEQLSISARFGPAVPSAASAPALEWARFAGHGGAFGRDFYLIS